MLKDFLAVAAGGAIGASLRAFFYLLFSSVSLAGLPWGQIIANVSGAFSAGFIFCFSDVLGKQTQSFLLVGFLGSLTTMSAFALDVFEMLHHKLYFQALLLWLSGSFICVIMAAIGYYAASWISAR